FQLRVSSPAALSTLRTSAPKSARVMEHSGPARMRERSMTLIPSSGWLIRFHTFNPQKSLVTCCMQLYVVQITLARIFMMFRRRLGVNCVQAGAERLGLLLGNQG